MIQLILWYFTWIFPGKILKMNCVSYWLIAWTFLWTLYCSQLSILFTWYFQAIYTSLSQKFPVKSGCQVIEFVVLSCDILHGFNQKGFLKTSVSYHSFIAWTILWIISIYLFTMWLFLFFKIFTPERFYTLYFGTSVLSKMDDFPEKFISNRNKTNVAEKLISNGKINVADLMYY